MKIKCDSYDKNKCYECVYLEQVDEKGFSSYPERDWEKCLGIWEYSTTGNSFTWRCTRRINATWVRNSLEIVMMEIIKEHEENKNENKM
jgi:hypothetical protein